MVDWFVPKGYAVYAFDLRGFGHSPGPRGYINEWAEYRQDVKAFLEFMHEQEPGQAVFLLGHSMGGLVVQATIGELLKEGKADHLRRLDHGQF